MQISDVEFSNAHHQKSSILERLVTLCILFTCRVIWPNGITIDFSAERLYWVDASKDYIGSSDLSGKNNRKILQQDTRISHPFAVAVLNGLMYWDDWKLNSIFSAVS
jgi:hypothetical protein